MSDNAEGGAPAPSPHRRRPRYSGKNPRKFSEKYKEHAPERYAETVEKVLASGKTPAGAHRPIMVPEILEVLDPKLGQIAVDCTLGHGGHAQEILRRITPGGRLIGLDVDPRELPRTEARLRGAGFGVDVFAAHRSNYAGLPKVLGTEQLTHVDLILADLGLSSMQIDNPERGFSIKMPGPLDMRMNPDRGEPASEWLRKVDAERLAGLLAENDEPQAGPLAGAIAGGSFSTTVELARAIRRVLPRGEAEESDLAIRRVFQAIRIAVNDEFAALETFLRAVPGCLQAGGRVAVLTFHSGEDRRVKKAFQAGLHSGAYSEVAREVIRASSEERRANPRSTSAKLRWARRA